MRDWLEDLRDHWDDAYWHADHPEVKAILIAIVTAAIGLLFAWLQIRMENHYRRPRTRDV